MERGETSGGGGAEKAENLWEKLRRVGKRGGNSTPAASFWRKNELGSQELHDTTNLYQGPTFGSISSRKLAAALWDLHYYKLPLDNLRRGITAPPPPRLRHHKRGPYKDVGGPEPLDPPPTSSDMVKGSRLSLFLLCNSKHALLFNIELLCVCIVFVALTLNRSVGKFCFLIVLLFDCLIKVLFSEMSGFVY